MASRVNTRFVVILIVGVVGVLGMLMLAWSVAHKSAGDLAKRGDAFMAQGDYVQAEKAYSKAVNKDATDAENLGKWVDSISKLIPETETEYLARFRDYSGAIRQTATVLRNNADAHERYLAINYEILKSGYTRGGADALIEDDNGSLAFFSDFGGEVQSWERLKRYRGLAIVEIAKNKGLLKDEQYALAQDDLERAIEADPNDVESVIGLMLLQSILTDRSVPKSDIQSRIATAQANQQVADAFLDAHQGNIPMLIQRVFLKADLDRLELMLSSKGQDNTESVAAAFAEYSGDIQSIADELVGSAREQLNIDVLRQFMRLERFFSPGSKLANTQRLIDLMVDSDKANAALLMLAGQVAEAAGEPDESIGWYARIGDLETKPVSYQGYRQYGIKRDALFALALIRVSQAQVLAGTGTPDEVDEAVKVASEARDRFASSVNDDNLALVMLDGKLARAKGGLDEALRLFKKYNEQTQRNSPEGLWQEGSTAAQLGQFGVARKALLEEIALDTTNRKIQAMLALAQIDISLKDYDHAAKMYKDILVTNPKFQAAVDGLDAVNMMLNPQLNENPVIGAVLTARQMRLGTSDTPGDYAGAVEYLRDASARLDNDPMIARELAGMLLDNNDILGARDALNKSQAAHPGDESLNSLVQALQSDDLVDIKIELQRQSGRDPLDILLTIAKIASQNDRRELLATTIEKLNAMAPDDRRVIDVTFVNALQYDDLDTAQRIAESANNTQIQKLTYEARIAMKQNEAEKAIDLLKQVVATGSGDASTFQLLAMLQRKSGYINEAIDSFERAMAIRPDNPQTVTEYIWTLAISAKRYEDALSAARRLQQYGSSNPTFMNLWLNLESVYGGEKGRDFAIRQRERILELDPANIENRFQLARMYTSGKDFDKARKLIDELRAEHDQLSLVELDASWYADQGTYQGRSGLEVANEVYAKYVEGLETPVGTEPFVSNAQFMLRRGRPDLAVIAANAAVAHQDPKTMLGSKLLGDLYLSINKFSEAADAYQAVIDADADPDLMIHKSLIDTDIALNQFADAQKIYDQLPPESRTEIGTMVQAADIARGLGDDARARKLLDDTVARYPNNAYVYIKRAQSMVGDEASLTDLLSDISRAIDLDPNNSQSYRVRAAGYFAVGREDDALKDLRTAIRLNPNLDTSVYAVLNELLTKPGHAGEALDVAREVISRRPDDANLMSRIGGLFASRKDWARASEMYGLAWNKRRGVTDGAIYIDTLLRMNPPDTDTATQVTSDLSKIVGDINKIPGLLAAQALVLQARGRDDFAQQQLTKAFDLSVKDDKDLLNWSGNLTRYFEGQPRENQVRYLEALKRRNADPGSQAWLDLFIARRLVADTDVDDRGIEIVKELEGYSENPAIQLRAFQTHGSTLYNQDKFEDAAKVWKAGIKLFPDDWEMNNNLAYVLSTELGQSDEALVYGQVAIDQNKSRSEAYETMAGIYTRLKKYDEAQQMIDIGSNLIQNIPARVTMTLAEGRLELARGKSNEASKRLHDAQESLRSSPTAYLNLEEDIAKFGQEIESAGG